MLVSRLGMLDPQKIAHEMGYLQIAIDKTAGEAEQQAWRWLLAAIEQHHPGLAAGGHPEEPGLISLLASVRDVVEAREAAAAGADLDRPQGAFGGRARRPCVAGHRRHRGGRFAPAGRSGR